MVKKRIKRKNRNRTADNLIMDAVIKNAIIKDNLLSQPVSPTGNIGRGKCLISSCTFRPLPQLIPAVISNISAFTPKDKVKLYIGCGNDKRKGWINLDYNPGVNPDIVCDAGREKLPFQDNSVDVVYMKYSLEHIPREKFLDFLDDVWRILKHGGIFHTIVPHYTSSYNLKILTHYTSFGIDSFKLCEPKVTGSGERYCKARFEVLKEELGFMARDSENFKILHPFTVPFNWFFNLGGRKWKIFWEKFNLLGFEDIEYVLRAVKKC